MSDLQCPARLYVAWPATAHVVAEDLVPADEVLSAVLEEGPGADLEAIADVHRGEAVLVLVTAAPPALPTMRRGQVVALEVDSEGLRALE